MVRITKALKNRKRVLGLNERYLEYIRPNNLRSAFEIADDKVLTKKILEKYEIPVPEQIAIIANNKELENVDFDSFPKSFVIKPVHGVRGGGVEIFYNRDKSGEWIRSDGSRVSISRLKMLCRDIMDGKYSLHNEPDIVLVEERVKAHKAFRYHSYKGTPDIRIIVFNKIPVMGMLRLPTEVSKGKANLDQGAIGTGIDMAVGKTTSAIYGKSGAIERVPHTKLPISGLRIPYWTRMLRYAVESSKVTKLGFAAVDFLLDKDKGPVIVELNARAGLSIQLANHVGLRARLKKAGDINVKSTDHAIRLAKDMFGGEIEEGIEAMAGKDVIGIYENITLFGKGNESHDCKAKIDTGADSTSIDREIALKLGYKEIIDAFDAIELPEDINKVEGRELMKKLSEELVPQFEELEDVNLIHSSHGSSLRPYVKIKMKIDTTEFETKATIYDRSKLKYPVIVGRKSLRNFLVDPSKN